MHVRVCVCMGMRVWHVLVRVYMRVLVRVCVWLPQEQGAMGSALPCAEHHHTWDCIEFAQVAEGWLALNCVWGIEAPKVSVLLVQVYVNCVSDFLHFFFL